MNLILASSDSSGNVSHYTCSINVMVRWSAPVFLFTRSWVQILAKTLSVLTEFFIIHNVTRNQNIHLTLCKDPCDRFHKNLLNSLCINTLKGLFMALWKMCDSVWLKIWIAWHASTEIWYIKMQQNLWNGYGMHGKVSVWPTICSVVFVSDQYG
jgi:hypothetical protein